MKCESPSYVATPSHYLQGELHVMQLHMSKQKIKDKFTHYLRKIFNEFLSSFCCCCKFFVEDFNELQKVI